MMESVAQGVAGAATPAMARSIEEVSRADVARERVGRLRAEAHVAQAEQRARSAEERATRAEWLVALLRSELVGPGPERRRWWCPWRRATPVDLSAHPEDLWERYEALRRQSRASHT
jgi:hypothetical protein